MTNITRLTIIKFLELVLVCILLGLHYNSAHSGLNSSMISTSTFGGYLIILIGLFAGAVMGTPVNRRIDLFFSLVGFVLFIISGIFAFQEGNGSTYTIKGVIAIIEAVLFLIDAVLTFRGEA